MLLVDAVAVSSSYKSKGIDGEPICLPDAKLKQSLHKLFGMAFLYFIARDVQLVAAFLADKLVWSHGDG
jgi:hypothetical protein